LIENESKSNSKHTSFSELEEKVNSTHPSMLELEEETSRFNNLYPYERVIHPFDEKDKNWQRYITNPIDSELFVAWKDYDVNYKEEDGQSWCIHRAQNYYSYWQIYEINGINDFRKNYYTICFNEKENVTIQIALKSFKHFPERENYI